MRRLTFVFLCAVFLSVGLQSAQAEQRKIGLLLKGRTNFWSTVEQGAKAAAAELGVELIVKAPPTESDVAIQIQQLNALAAQKVECIIIAPINAEALAHPAAAVAVAGVKIVVLDSPLNGKTASVFIGTDHEAAGAAAGRLLATLIGEDDRVSILRHSQGNLVTLAREDSAISAFKAARPGATIFSEVYLGNAKEEQAGRAQLLLTKHPEVKAVMASSTPGTTTLLELLGQSPTPGAVKLVGFGYNLNEAAATALTNGRLHGWIAQLPLEMGRLGVKNAVAVISGQNPPAVVHTDFRVVTKDNLQDPEVQALLKL
jgi:ribose transport system substrate-binding protein